jgi:hypothetical protein
MESRSVAFQGSSLPGGVEEQDALSRWDVGRPTLESIGGEAGVLHSRAFSTHSLIRKRGCDSPLSLPLASDLRPPHTPQPRV